jgi:hypothetical protein
VSVLRAEVQYHCRKSVAQASRPAEPRVVSAFLPAASLATMQGEPMLELAANDPLIKAYLKDL